MSTDRTTEILNYLSAISREVGELRTEINSVRVEMNARLERIERELRQHGRRLDRIESLVLTTRADIDELQERVETLEGKQA
jgi:chromosome segregation ATPase